MKLFITVNLFFCCLAGCTNETLNNEREATTSHANMPISIDYSSGNIITENTTMYVEQWEGDFRVRRPDGIGLFLPRVVLQLAGDNSSAEDGVFSLTIGDSYLRELREPGKSGRSLYLAGDSEGWDYLQWQGRWAIERMNDEIIIICQSEQVVQYFGNKGQSIDEGQISSYESTQMFFANWDTAFYVTTLIDEDGFSLFEEMKLSELSDASGFSAQANQIKLRRNTDLPRDTSRDSDLLKFVGCDFIKNYETGSK